MVEVGRIIDQLTFPLNVAAGLEARGIPPGPPKTIVSEESRGLYAKIVRELAALFQRHRLGLAAAAAAGCSFLIMLMTLRESRGPMRVRSSPAKAAINRRTPKAGAALTARNRRESVLACGDSSPLWRGRMAGAPPAQRPATLRPSPANVHRDFHFSDFFGVWSLASVISRAFCARISAATD